MTAAVAIAGLSLRDYSRTPEQRGWGPPCRVTLVRVQLTEAAVSVDARLAELSGLVMRANERQGYLYRRADTGAYNCRLIAGTDEWSWHARAIAIDANWQTNPYTSPLRTDRPQWERDRWNRYGFAGGWDYTGAKDAMHTEFMGTPAQAAALTAVARRELSGTVVVAWGPYVTATPGLRTLERGYRGTDVTFVQQWAGVPGDGEYGDGTAAAVKTAQTRNRLAADGIVGPATWAAMGVSPPALSVPAVSLAAGHVLVGGQSLVAGAYRLAMQRDGNTVLYGSGGKTLWNTDTNGHDGAWLVLQGDGNLVVYDGLTAVWSSRTQGKGGTRLVMQTDGNLVLYDSGNRPVWASGTRNQ